MNLIDALRTGRRFRLKGNPYFPDKVFPWEEAYDDTSPYPRRYNTRDILAVWEVEPKEKPKLKAWINMVKELIDEMEKALE